MPSENSKLVLLSKDLTRKDTQKDGELATSTKSKAGLNSWSLNFRQLCVMGTAFGIVTGFLSSSYLEASFQVLMQHSLDPMSSESVPHLRSVIDAVASDRSLQISGEDSVETFSSPKNGLTACESVQEEDSKTEKQKSNPETEIPEDVVWSPGYAREEQEKSLEPSSEGRQQNGNLRSSGENSTSVESKEEQEKSPEEITPHRPYIYSSKKVNSSRATGACDFTAGKWVHEPAGPLYRSDQCRILSQPQNCQHNGRPDHGYEFYKWELDQCSIPRFDPKSFLELMRGKTVAFVGDSLARNQMESLMCILLQVAEARPKGNRNVHKWYFPSHKFTVVRMWSSWLVQTKGVFPPSVAPPNVTKLNLTELDFYANHLPRFDVTILSSGHWWFRKTAYFMNGEMVGGVGWPWLPSYGAKKLETIEAFGIALNTSLQKVGTYPGYKGLTILRTYTPDHYSGGSWNTGGSCTGEAKPYDKAPENNFNELMRQKQLNAFDSNTKGGEIMPNGSKLRLLDVYPILNYRGDGHPGPYRNTDPQKKTTRDANGRPPPQDCLHWCMPGPLDNVNELLFEMLREEQ